VIVQRRNKLGPTKHQQVKILESSSNTLVMQTASMTLQMKQKIDGGE
jgi:hypothetical protein